MCITLITIQPHTHTEREREREIELSMAVRLGATTARASGRRRLGGRAGERTGGGGRGGLSRKEEESGRGRRTGAARRSGNGNGKEEENGTNSEAAAVKSLEARAKRAEAELKAKTLASTVTELELRETVDKMSLELNAMKEQLETADAGKHVQRDAGTLVGEIRRLEALMARMVDAEAAAAAGAGAGGKANGVSDTKSTTESPVNAKELASLQLKLKAVTAAEAKASSRCNALLAEVRRLEAAVAVLFDQTEMEAERGRRHAAEQEVTFLEGQLKTLQKQVSIATEGSEAANAKVAGAEAKAAEADAKLAAAVAEADATIARLEEETKALYTADQLESLVADVFESKNETIASLEQKVAELSAALVRPTFLRAARGTYTHIQPRIFDTQRAGIGEVNKAPNSGFARATAGSYQLKSRTFVPLRASSADGSLASRAFARAPAGSFVHIPRTFPPRKPSDSA